MHQIRIGELSLTIIVLFVLFAFSFSTYKYKALPSRYLPKTSTNTYDNQVKQLKAYDITKSLPKGYATNGTVDYTKFLQGAINKHNIIQLPNFPVLTTGIYVKSNSTLIFPVSAKLVMKPTNAEKYRVIAIRGVENVTIYHPNIEGERNNHIGSSGEWGHGIEITLSKNIYVVEPTIKNCWGDAIYIGTKSDKSIPVLDKFNNDNINIINAIIDNNRRNGISIIEGMNINITSAAISNCNGVSPMVGIDIEPNNNRGNLNNIVIKNAVTYNNKNVGIDISLTGLVGTLKKSVNIVVENHIDDGSKCGFYIARYKDKPSIKPSAFDGVISIINPTWINNKLSFQAMDTKELAPILKISGAKIVNRTEDGKVETLSNTNDVIRKNIHGSGRISIK